MLFRPGDFEDLMDLRTESSSDMEKGMQLIGRVSETRWLKKVEDRSGGGCSVPRRDLKCSNQTLSRCLVVPRGLYYKARC